MNSRVSSGVVGGSLDVADMMESTDGRSMTSLVQINPLRWETCPVASLAQRFDWVVPFSRPVLAFKRTMMTMMNVSLDDAETCNVFLSSNTLNRCSSLLAVTNRMSRLSIARFAVEQWLQCSESELTRDCRPTNERVRRVCISAPT